MKNTYTAPCSKTRSLDGDSPLSAVSGQNNGTTIIGGGDDGGDPGDALGKGFSFNSPGNDLWDEDEDLAHNTYSNPADQL